MQHTTSLRMTLRIAFILFCALPLGHLIGQNRSPSSFDSLQVPASGNLAPHLENVNGHQVLYVDGEAFTALAVEIPWWDLVYRKYKETEGAYDTLYPAAANLGLNTLKVPVKWSMIEPEKGTYDFSYVDHAKRLAEQNHLKLILNWFGHYASADGTSMEILPASYMPRCTLLRTRKPTRGPLMPMVSYITMPSLTITNL